MTKGELRKARKQARAEGRPLVGELAIPGQQPTRVTADEGRIVTARRLRRRERVASRAEQQALYLDCGPAAWDGDR